jgi:protease I
MHKPEIDTYRPANQNLDNGKAVLILTADDTEDLEFFYPYYRFIEAGYKVDVATPKGESFKAKHGLGLKDTRRIADVRASDYRMLYIPGGKAPAALKKEEAALELVRQFAATPKIIAAICHGPQLLAKADVIRGKQIAAWPDVEDEVKEAGAVYISQETVVDGRFVTARWPGDLPSHMKRVLQMLDQHIKDSLPRASAA